MLWPSNRRDIIGMTPVFHTGYLAYTQQNLPQRNLSFFGNDTIEETASIPEGSFQSRSCILAPLVAGGMASANNATDITLTGTANVLAGGPMTGTGTITLDSTVANLSLTVGLSGTSTITMTSTTANLSLTIGLSGTGSWTLTGTSALAMIVPFSGTGSWALTGTADLRELLSLSGSWSPFTELSPENLAIAVWQYIIENGYSAEELVRLLTSVAAGKTNIIDLGGGNATVEFRDLANTKNRVDADMTGSERTTVTLDLT